MSAPIRADLDRAQARLREAAPRHDEAADRTLTDGDVDAIAEATARRVAAMVGPSTTFGLVGPRKLAQELGVSTDYVYAHATELGAMRLGSGPKARLRFDLDAARQALEARRRPSPERRSAGRNR